jgi:hypothetical protein
VESSKKVSGSGASEEGGGGGADSKKGNSKKKTNNKNSGNTSSNTSWYSNYSYNYTPQFKEYTSRNPNANTAVIFHCYAHPSAGKFNLIEKLCSNQTCSTQAICFTHYFVNLLAFSCMLGVCWCTWR